MPILYVDSPLLREDPPTDEVAEKVAAFQWVDWTKLRFASRDSTEYRSAVASMAQRLADANLKADESNSLISVGEGLEEEDDAPGSADLMARAEEVMPDWAETINALGTAIQDIAAVANAGSERLDAVSDRGFAARLTAMRQMATELQRPADSVEENSAKFTAQLNDVDAGLLEMIPMIAAEAEKNPSTRKDACEFFASIRELSESADSGLGGLKELVDTIQPIEGMSRDLRRPLKTLRRGLTLMHESRKVMNAWVALIDETGIDCDS